MRRIRFDEVQVVAAPVLTNSHEKRHIFQYLCIAVKCCTVKGPQLCDMAS